MKTLFLFANILFLLHKHSSKTESQKSDLQQLAKMIKSMGMTHGLQKLLSREDLQNKTENSEKKTKKKRDKKSKAKKQEAGPKEEAVVDGPSKPDDKS